jgi:hypothetical protein
VIVRALLPAALVGRRAEAGFAVRDKDGQALGVFLLRARARARSALGAKLLSKDDARLNVAKLPELLRRRPPISEA